MSNANEVEDDLPLWEQPKLDGPLIPTPAGAPENLEMRHQAPKPLKPEQGALETQLKGERRDGSQLPHRFVTIGDSITQGFQSMAIHRTDLSWPAMVAQAYGVNFTYPKFDGPLDNPGLPMNLESLSRNIEAAIGERPLPFHEDRAIGRGLVELENIRRYWEHGEGSNEPGAQNEFFDNLAIWGWDLRDSLSKSRQWCEQQVSARVPWHERFHLARYVGVTNANEITAVRTLWNTAMTEEPVTQVRAAQALGAEGIETLVVALGANNALKSVLKLDEHIAWSQDEGFQNIDVVDEFGNPTQKCKDDYTVWTPDHFRAELDELVSEIVKVNAAHTLWLTVPHVTVVPLLRGVGEKPYNSRYFARYTRPWISDSDFDPETNRYMTGQDARAIDAATSARTLPPRSNRRDRDAWPRSGNNGLDHPASTG